MAMAMETIAASDWPTWLRDCGRALLIAPRQSLRFTCLKSWKRLSKRPGAERHMLSGQLVNRRGLYARFHILLILAREKCGTRIAERIRQLFHCFSIGPRLLISSVPKNFTDALTAPPHSAFLIAYFWDRVH